MADLVTEELQEEEAGAEEGKKGGGMGAGGLETAGTKKDDDDVVVVDAAACCTVGGVDLTKEQLAELKDIFSRFDRDQDGSITELELGSLLRSLGLKPAGHQLEALLQRADTNSNGYIEFSEFVALIGPEMVTTVPYNDKELLAVFRAFDRDGNGFITAAELVHSMARLGHSLTVRELSDMIREADTDGDGRISFQEFATAMSSASSLDVVL